MTESKRQCEKDRDREIDGNSHSMACAWGTNLIIILQQFQP